MSHLANKLAIAFALAVALGVLGCADIKSTLYGEGLDTRDRDFNRQIRSEASQGPGTGLSTKAVEIERRLGYQ